MIFMLNLMRGAYIAVKECLGLREGEEFLIITDMNKYRMGKVLALIGAALNGIVSFVEIPVGERPGSEPPKAVAEAMKAADVVLIPTTHSMTHTQATGNALKAGARVVTMPGVTEEMFKGPLTCDYKEVEVLTRKLGDLLTKANKASITSPSGTNLTIYLEDREGWLDTGIFHKPGDVGNLPAGEAFIAPEEDKGDGVLIIEPVSTMVEDYTKVVLENGRIIEIEETLSGKRLKNFLEAAGENAFIIAELGIGTNPKAKITGNLLEDEKVINTCHVAFGHNLNFGGKNKANTHIDFVITDPTLKLEIGEKEVTVLDKGKLLPP